MHRVPVGRRNRKKRFEMSCSQPLQEFSYFDYTSAQQQTTMVSCKSNRDNDLMVMVIRGIGSKVAAKQWSSQVTSHF